MISMIVEIVTTGSELLLGQIINTNVAYMSRRLNELGFDVVYQSTVGDNHDRMKEVLEHALSRADIVITSGGLGPTQGDITKEVSAEIFGRKLKLHPESKRRMDERFAMRHIVWTENNLRQVILPEGAEVFLNYNGIASGVVLENNGKYLINLPGPPSEMKDMFERSLKPFLKRKFGFKHVIVSKVLNTCGIGESLLETKIKDLILAQSNPTLALLIRPTGVIIRITAKADTRSEAEVLIAAMDEQIRQRVGGYIYAVNDEKMEDVISRLLLDNCLTVSCAESCTGGMLAARLTSVSGSSAYIQGSIVTYSNEAKMKFLNVDKKILETKGAVSEEVAKQMAQGIIQTVGSDIGIGITGIAGPTGATAEKPVGLVYIAISGKFGTVVTENIFSGDRENVRYRSTQQALEMLRQYITKNFRQNK